MKYRIIGAVILLLIVFGCAQDEPPENANWRIYFHQGYLQESYYATGYEMINGSIVVRDTDGRIRIYTPNLRRQMTFRATPMGQIKP